MLWFGSMSDPQTGRLLKGYQEVANAILLCLLPLVTSFPVPNLVPLWPSIVLFFFKMLLHLCLIYVCIIMLYFGPWTVLGLNNRRDV